MFSSLVEDLIVTDAAGTAKSMTFRIKSSKTDCFRREHTITLHATGSEDCPVAAVSEWLEVDAGSETSALFRTSKGNITRTDVAKVMKETLTSCGLRGERFNTHSFRIGGCVTLAAAGYTEAVISCFGRWASSCWKEYLVLDQSTLRDVCVRMSRVTTQDVQARGHGGLRSD